MNKKGTTITIALTLVPIMLYLMIVAYIEVGSKTKDYYGKMGSMQNNLLRTYHKGELVLIYIDQAAKYSVYNSILPIMEKGGFTDKPPCGYDSFEDDKDYVLWQKVYKKEVEYTPTGIAYASSAEFEEKTCYPKKSDIKKSLISSFNKGFNEYAEKYPTPIIPKNNYDLILEEKEGKQEIIGIATQNLIFPPDINKIRERILPTITIEVNRECLSKGGIPEYYSEEYYSCNKCPEKATCSIYNTITNCNYDPCNIGCEWRDQECKEMKRDIIYSIKPSFRLEASYNFINKFDDYQEKVEEIKEKVRDCLKIGSGKSGDVDIIECTKNENLEIENIENYEIWGIPPEDDTTLPGYDHIRIPSKKYYTVLFKIKEPSLYSNEEITTKFAIELLDNTPPPATEITTYKGDWPLPYQGSLYLRWKSNPASDVLAYYIYYKKIEKTLDGKEIPASPPTEISQMDNFAGQKTYESNIIEITPLNQDNINQKPSSSAYIIWAPFIEWKVDSSLEGDYYFIIVAQDKFGNMAAELAPKKVHIPTKEEIEEAQQEQVTDLSELFNIQ